MTIHINVCLEESAYAFLENFSPSCDLEERAALALHFGVQQIQQGALQVFGLLDAEECKAIITALDKLSLDYRMSLRTEMFNWFNTDDGQRLNWTTEAKAAFFEKIEKMTPAQTLGIMCWAQGFHGLPDRDLDAYISDISPLLVCKPSWYS